MSFRTNCYSHIEEMDYCEFQRIFDPAGCAVGSNSNGQLKDRNHVNARERYRTQRLVLVCQCICENIFLMLLSLFHLFVFFVSFIFIQCEFRIQYATRFDPN